MVTNAGFSRNYPSDVDTPKGSSTSGYTGATFGRASTSGVQKTYLPPFATQTVDSARGQTSVISGSSVPTFATRGSSGRVPGVKTAYLPPSAAGTPRGPAGISANRGSAGSSFGVQKAYLPPFASQTGNGLRRQQSFDSKNGYRY